MIRQVEVQKYQTKFNYTNTISNGGFFAYWKLIPKLFSMAVNTPASLFQRVQILVIFVCKLPWWGLIKPLGWAFSSKTNHSGSYLEVRHNGILQNQEFTNQEKNVTYYFLSCPIWAYSGKFNNQDKEYLIKKLQKG